MQIWEAADQSWTPSDKLWGIIHGPSNYWKAGFSAMRALAEPLPRGAFILKATTLDPGLATAAFYDVRNKVIVIAIVNNIDEDKVAQVFVKGVQVLGRLPASSIWAANGQVNQIRESITLDTSDGIFVTVQTRVDSIIVLSFMML